MKFPSLTPVFAVPASFTAAIFALVLSVPAGAADVPMAKPADAAPATPPTELRRLSGAQLHKLILMNQDRGLDQFIAEPFAVALQLGKPGDKVAGRQTLIDLGPDKVIFTELKGSAAGYTVGLVASDGIYIFRLDPNLQLVAAAQKMLGADIAVISEDRARQNLAVVFDLLAKVADTLPATNQP